MFRTKCTLYDAIAIGIVLLAAALLFWQPWNGRANGSVLVVTTPEETFEYSLKTDREITVSANGYTLCITISDRYAEVTKSNCPDGICRSSGRIIKSGDTVICAPAGISITIKGEHEDVDFVAG